MRRSALAVLAVLFASSAPAATGGFADRVYALDCGTLTAPDKSLWTPGKNVGTPALLSENCYLIKHGADYFLWDTGIADALTRKPLTTHGMTLQRDTPLAQQLKTIGVAPSQIRQVAVSHTHPDHTGNLNLVPDATLLIQRKEVDWSATAGFFKLTPDRKADLLDGDKDVFGDGSVTILSTPGHTPGHQSLLVHLKKSGWMLLSGDVAHLRENYAGEISPSINNDATATIASIKRVKGIVAEKKAKILINHDKGDSDGTLRPPKFYN